MQGNQSQIIALIASSKVRIHVIMRYVRAARDRNSMTAGIEIPEGFMFPGDDSEPAWKRYEKAIARIEELAADDNCRVIRNHKVKGRSGTERQVDVWVESRLGDNHVVAVAIECRCYDHGPVAIKDMDAFVSAVEDMGAHKGVMISHSGFTEGAENRAANANIELRTMSLEEAEGFAWDEYLPDLCQSLGGCYGSINWSYSEGNESAWGTCSYCGSFHIRCRSCGSIGCYEESRIVHCEGCEMRFRLLSEDGMTVGIEEIAPQEGDSEDDQG